MLSVSSGYKSATRTSPTNTVIKSNGKISVYDTVALTTKVFDNSKVGLIEVTCSAFNNQRIIGNVVAHLLKVEMYGDTSADFNLNSEKHITPSFGVLVGASYEWVDYQKFIVTEVEYDDTTRMTMIKGVDFTYKTNIEFVDTNTYPMSLFDYATSVATACGMSIENVSLVNGSFSIASKPFVDFTSCRYILSKIAELGGYFIHINKVSGKLEFKSAFPNTGYTHEELSNMTHDEIALLTNEELLGDSVETFTLDNYFNLKVKEHNFGVMGVNTLVMRISQVEGENDTVNNADNVAIDGSIEVQIVDNDIVNTSAKRLLVIDDLFDVIDRFKYIPYRLDYVGYSWLEIGDVITLTKKDNSLFSTMITDYTIRYNGALFGTLQAQALNKVQTTYQNLPSSIKRLRNAEIKVDKVEAEIELKVSQEDLETQLENYSTITQTATDISLAVSSIKVGGNNKVLNGNFFNDFESWTNNGSATGGSRSIITEGDKKYFRLVSAGTSSFYGVRQDVSPYEHGKDITVSLLIRRNSGTGRFRFRIESLGDGVQSPIVDNFITPTTTLERYAYTFTSSDVSSKNVYRVFLIAETNATAEFDMTEIQVEVGNKDTGYKQNNNEIRTSKIKIVPNLISAQTDGFEWRDSGGNLKVYFDTVNSVFTFEGKIVADSGLIGGFTIGATKLTAGSTNATAVGVQSGETIAFFAGHLTPSSAPFRVTRAGALTSTSGTIGGWTISSGSISKGTITLDSANERIYVNTSAYLYGGASSSTIYTSGSLDVNGNVSGDQFTTNSILPSANNTYSLGTSSFRWLTIWQQSGSVVGSDIRLKKDISVIDKGVELIMNLKPVQYVLKDGQSGRKHYGFIAQEVKEAMTLVGIDDFGGYVNPTVSEKDLDIDGQMLALRYDEFIAPLVKTVQFLYNEIKLLKGEK